jgi:hypothetical protein
MLTKLYTYFQKYKDEQIEVTKNSTLFRQSITVYNNTIYKLIQFFYKLKYTPPTIPDIVFHEDCIYY